MPSGLEALGVAVFFLAPGLLYELGIERQVGFWRTSLADRTLRFFTLSIIFQVPAMPILVWLRARYLDTPHDLEAVPWPVAAAVGAYVAGPLVAGLLVGRGVRERAPWTNLFVGREPAPTAWDHLFSTVDLEGYVRVQLADGTWLGGVYGTHRPGSRLRGWASSYPEQPDLFLPRQVEIDAATGELVTDDSGNAVIRDWSVWVRHDEIRRLEILITDGGSEAHEQDG